MLSTLPKNDATKTPSPPPPPPPTTTDTTILARLSAASLPYRQLSRIDKPVGTYLLYLPCTWSILAAASTHGIAPLHTASMLALFGTGAFVMRGAGCTINDLWDQDFDKRVERTRSRPLAAGTVTVPQAVAWLGVQCSVGLAVLMQMNWLSIAIGASSMVLVVAYPLMKRITYYPQVVLGLAFNWGALLGYPALTGTFELLPALPLYTAGIAWTLIYDTLYAHQDKRDDVAIGVKSTALAFGDQGTKPVLYALSGVAGVSLAAAGVSAGFGVPWAVGSAAGVANMVRMTHGCNLADPASCGKAFLGSTWAGVWIALGAAVEYGLRVVADENEEEADVASAVE
ncbi:4-hydroxybenzoate polyprenyl transferase [Blastocladiella britannica]|nr:4-hydroxybenzoate polyprenyl transferase [Blastocladiella britannica]